VVRTTYSRGRRKPILVDTCVILHYLLGDDLADNAERFIRNVVKGSLEAHFISEAYDDAITGLRSRGVSDDVILDILEKWASIPHKVLPVIPTIAVEALKIYRQHGGPRKLHYFDAFHVAGAKHYHLPLLTSDEYIINHSKELGIETINLRDL